MAFNFNASQARQAQPMAEINTTPLVDVMLVLLVIFLITAPLFNQAVPVDLPKVQAAKLEQLPRTVQVAINGEGETLLDGQPITMPALREQLQRTAAPGVPAPELHLRADRGTRYERVTEVMALAQSAGIVKIAFVTEQPGKDAVQ